MSKFLLPIVLLIVAAPAWAGSFATSASSAGSATSGSTSGDDKVVLQARADAAASSPAMAASAVPAWKPRCGCCASAGPMRAPPATCSWRRPSWPGEPAPPVGWRLAVAAALVGLALPAAASGVQVEPRGLDAAQRQASQRSWLEAVEARLPPAWRGRHARRICGCVGAMTCRRRCMAAARARQSACAANCSTAGWRARSAPASRIPAARAALAALIHELAHVLDRGPAGGLSRDPRLLDLAGWQLRPLRLGLRGRRNPFTDRSPGPLRTARPRRVRRGQSRMVPAGSRTTPAAGRHWRVISPRRFGWQPPTVACAPGLVFLQAGTGRGNAWLRTHRPGPRVCRRLPAGRGQRRADEPLGPQHAAAGDLRARPRAGAGLQAGPAASPRAQLPRLRRRRADLQLARPDRALSVAAVPAAAGPGDRRVHPGRVARPALDPAARCSRATSPSCWSAPRGCTGATTAATTSSATTARWKPSGCCTTACRGWPRCHCAASPPPGCCTGCSAAAWPMSRCWTTATRRCATVITSNRRRRATGRCSRWRGSDSRCRKRERRTGWRCPRRDARPGWTAATCGPPRRCCCWRRRRAGAPSCARAMRSSGACWRPAKTAQRTTGCACCWPMPGCCCARVRWAAGVTACRRVSVGRWKRRRCGCRCRWAANGRACGSWRRPGCRGAAARTAGHRRQPGRAGRAPAPAQPRTGRTGAALSALSRQPAGRPAVRGSPAIPAR